MWVVFVLRLSVLGAVRIGRCASLLARVRVVRAERAGRLFLPPGAHPLLWHNRHRRWSSQR